MQKPRGKTRKSLATVMSKEVAARARGMDKGAESATKKALKKRETVSLKGGENAGVRAAEKT